MSKRTLIYVIFVIFSTVVEANLTTVSTDSTINCEENMTCIVDENTTLTTENILYTTEMETGKEKNISVNITYKIPKKRRGFKRDYECLCDLKLDSCDINCCCDHDCGPEQKLVFSYCKKPEVHYNPYYCYSKDLIFINNTPVNWERNNYGLFCIVKENLPAYHILQLKEPIEQLETAKEFTANKYTWSTKSQSKNDFELKSFLQYGDKIWIKRYRDSIETLSLPTSFISTSCVKNQDIKFLIDFSTTCNQILDENNPDLNPITYYDNITVLSFSIRQNNTQIEEYLHDCPRNICLPIQTYLCDGKLKTCVKINQNRTLHNISCELSGNFNKDKVCFFVAKRVKYEFLHNGTHGLIKINLYLHLTSATQLLYNYFTQKFEVKFLWYDDIHNDNFSTILSGNPGYIAGKPILFSKLINKVKNTTEAIIIEKLFLRNDTDFTKNFLVLPKNIDNYCVLNNETFEAVEFGYNGLYFCSHKFQLNKTLNATEVCCQLQKEILLNWEINFYNNSQSNIYVGMFGNANRSDVSEWIEIVYNFQENIFENITGFYNNDFLTCTSFATVLKINILYSNLDLKNIRNQAKILHVFYDLEIAPSLDLNLRYCKNQICITSLDIETKVMFYDVTYKKSNKNLEPPSLHLRLPQDLFYPFMSHSASGIFGKNKIYIISINVIVILLKFYYIL